MNKLSSKAISLLIFAILLIPSSSQAIADTLPGHSKTGPFVDTLDIKIVNSTEEQLSLLVQGDVDVITDIDPELVATYDGIQHEETLKNGFVYLLINCERYPLNETAFRRALALAVNKHKICTTAYDDVAIPLDSPLPQGNPMTIEETLVENYYNARVTEANTLLDNAGFLDVNDDGFREAPNGELFSVFIEHFPQERYQISASIVAEALLNVGIQVSTSAGSYYSYLTRLYSHGSPDIGLWAKSFNDYDVQWLAFDLSSKYAIENPGYDYWNRGNFSNETYDALCEDLLYSTEYDDIESAAQAMQEVIVEECPIIPLCQPKRISAYRTDRFEGLVEQQDAGLCGFWSTIRAYLNSEDSSNIFNSTLKIALLLETETINPMHVDANHRHLLYDLISDSMVKISPDGHDIGWLATDWFVETHADNPHVTDGWTRITFDLVSNATWNDGSELRGNDVAFTMNYLREVGFTHPVGESLRDVYAAYSPVPWKVVVEYKEESYWHVHNVAYKRVLPLENWLEITDYLHYEPDIETLLTSGPFLLDEYDDGSHYILRRNPCHFYHPDTSWSPTITNASDIIPLLQIDTLMVIIATACVIIIVGVIVQSRYSSKS